ncbi:AraC family transcriptional regulator [Chryseolinea lacunae]|uniref:Helix-turn-helix domain-containing protein n=1 Tax=Chryseolinea lacunae TaxID=2801331 RepID=A0ABS1KMI6_9BACT|nr:helix-turn-helix domain-containing protein [Chryseolinea lacunae]MBL0739867.1 helix-turn-helix domain-containing protein [Chryseolinea lacunae]
MEKDLLTPIDIQDDNFLNIYTLPSIGHAWPADGKLTNFEILWLTEGATVHEVNGLHHAMRKDSVFCGSPGQVHQLRQTAGMKAVVISFRDSFLREGIDDVSGVYDSELFEMFSSLAAIPLQPDIASEMHDIVEKMIREANGRQSLKHEFLRRYLKIFLLHVFRQFEQVSVKSSRVTGHVLVRKFMAAIEKDFKQKKSVMEYAAQLYVSPNYLNEVVKRVSGFSAGYHIRQRIIQEAKRRAKYSDSNMKEVAYELGFETPAHFSKFFKHYAGINFSSFKQIGASLSSATRNASDGLRAQVVVAR